MTRRPPRSTLTDTLFPYTTLFRSTVRVAAMHTCNASLSRRARLVYSPAMHLHPLISDTATLEKLCSRLATVDFVAVDTEFMRENTYWPDLCLIQKIGRAHV